MRYSLITILGVLVTIGCSRAPKEQTLTMAMFPEIAAGPRAISVSADIRVVDMVPQIYSNETNQDSEPNVSVNSNNPQQIVASAFTPGPFDRDANFCPSTVSPIYVSGDGGLTWSYNCVVPTYPSTFDITVRFGPISGNLYAAILLNGTSQMQVLRSASYVSPTPMEPVLSRAPFDQPYLEIARVGGAETVFVGENNCCEVPVAAQGKSATIDTSYNPAGKPASFSKVLLEQRTTFGSDLASIRISVHEADSAVYGLFMGQNELAADKQTRLADVVVVRDDRGGRGNPPYTDLKEPSDGKAGKIVAEKLAIPTGNLGQQRLQGQSRTSLGVDPRNVAGYPVYISWADKSSGADACTLHVRHSEDKGTTWSGDARTIPNATNPALAVNSDGLVALLYQQYQAAGNWETHLEVSGDRFLTKQDFVLSRAPDNGAVLAFDPYLGDYIHLVAVGRNFYGVFSALNTPDNANFPFTSMFANGLIYQRDADFQAHKLMDKTNHIDPVAPSIDPFFVRVVLGSPQM